MLYNSTRNSDIKATAAQAISAGISSEGGLYVPESFPQLTSADFDNLRGMSYIDRAKFVLSGYLTDFSEQELDYCVNGAYEKGKFATDDVAHLVDAGNGINVLELWHGPTCAFKDMALQILPFLLTVSAKKVSGGKTIVILVATSGDTGKAALEGFKDVDGTKIIVFYPEQGVSPMQKLQMATQEGENVAVCAIKGNFDDAQTGVKKIFTDKATAEKLSENNMQFSSANSINWGRLAPQIVYYISAYCDMINNGKINMGDKINIVVPTGNFGNILAAYYAKQMGLPVNKLICASNANNVLTDFISSGTYDRNRSFYTTISPSMDILISSNLERLIYDMSGRDSERISAWMQELSETGKYTVDDNIKSQLDSQFAAGYCDDEQTKNTIKEMFQSGYLCDTHTAVGIKVYKDYLAKTGDKTPVVIASTASPYKFSSSVLEAICGEVNGMSEFEKVDKLFEVSNLPVPKALSELEGKDVRFKNSCEKEDMENFVFDILLNK